MNASPYLGNEYIRHRVVYDSHNYCECIYCGKQADSREHIPSKVFLEKPYPDNLFLLPACKKCNNDFSDDELYTWFAIQTLKGLFYKTEYIISDMNEKRIGDHKDIGIRVNKDLEAFLCKSIDSINKDTVYNFKSEKIERILEKLAVGHSVFELSEGYYTGDESWTIVNMSYAFLPILSQSEIDDIDDLIEISNKPLPEIGTRIYDHIYVVEAMTNDKNIKFQFIMLDWMDIQEGKYRYTCANLGNEIVVKIVIDEFLYVIITFLIE